VKDLILLMSLDGGSTNLALEKIRTYHLLQGDRVFRNCWMPRKGGVKPDKIYVSCIFDWNRPKCERWLNIAEIGGSGYDIHKTLPPEIEAMNPKINLGFATRGCIRRCPFCIVPDKEGGIRRVADIYDIWDGESGHITLLDNNILADREHFFRICGQLIKEGLHVDFNQGLDIRLVDDEIARMIARLRMTKEVRFALDDTALIPVVQRKLALLRRYSDRRNYFVYVLCGYNTTIKEDFERLRFLKMEDCRPYVQLYGKSRESRLYREFARWVNMFWPFQKFTFEKWLFLRNYRHQEMERLI